MAAIPISKTPTAAEWLRQADLNGNLQRFLFPNLAAQERKAAEIEGWMLGIA